MFYSAASSNTADCNPIRLLIVKIKNELTYKQTLLQHQQIALTQSSLAISSELAGTNAQIDLYTTIDTNLPAGAQKASNTVALEGLTHRKFVLLKAQKERGIFPLPETEMAFALAEKQMAELDLILAAFTDRKAAL